MISFGSAAGCRISSGCGSKVRTVSAPSITARWPRWTPSKVPIATSRGRGSASSSGGDLDAHRTASATAGTSSATRSTGIRVAGVLDPERADRDAAQIRAVGVAEGLDQRAHVGAGRALDLVVGELVARPKAARRGGPRRRGAASPPFRRGGPCCRGARRRPAPRRSSAPAGARSRSAARARPGSRRSRSARRRGRRCSSASRAAQWPGRSSAARRGSAAAASPGRAGSAAGRWRRGRACRRARPCTPRSRRTAATTSCEVTPAGLSKRSTAPPASPRAISAPSWATSSSQRKSMSSSISRSVEKPAARLWPPPPCLRAIAETSTSPSLERRLTLRAAWPRSPRSRTTAATLVPSIERRWSITPSVISSPAPVAA